MSVHGNLYDDDWDDPYPTPEGWRSHFKHLGGRELALGLYELLPGQTQCPYHFHYGNHEALVVLAGAPTLRTPDGERGLGAGCGFREEDVPSLPSARGRGSARGAHR